MHLAFTRGSKAASEEGLGPVPIWALKPGRWEWRKSHEVTDTACHWSLRCSQQTGRGTGVERPQQGGGRRRLKGTQESLLGKGAREASACSGKTTCCLLPCNPHGPEEVWERPFPWTPAGCSGQLAVLASFYLPLQHFVPGRRQPKPCPGLSSLELCWKMGKHPPPTAVCCTPYWMGCFYTQGCVHAQNGHGGKHKRTQARTYTTLEMCVH